MNFNSIWLLVQKFYMSRASVIFVIATTAGIRSCRAFPAALVVIDESSQLKEIESLNAIVRHMSRDRLGKVVILDDQQQLPPTIPSMMYSEFGHSATMALMTRLIAAGHSYTMLTLQHRMHPHIVELINQNFYNGQLRTSPSTHARPSGALFRQWAFHEGLPSSRQALFVTVDDPVCLYVEANAHSKINTAYIHAVQTMIMSMLEFGIPAADILLIAFYAAQKRCYLRVFKALGIDLMIRSVDASQGKEKPIVILDMVTPGGPHYTMGFLNDMKRINVALSRAGDGLLIVGNHRMTTDAHPSKSLQAWRDVIKRIFTAGGGKSKYFGSDDRVREFLKLPGPLYQEAPRRGS